MQQMERKTQKNKKVIQGGKKFPELPIPSKDPNVNPILKKKKKKKNKNKANNRFDKVRICLMIPNHFGIYLTSWITIRSWKTRRSERMSNTTTRSSMNVPNAEIYTAQFSYLIN
jgi:hypothetical protein